MKWLALFTAELKLLAPKLPFALLAIVSIFGAVMAALPPSLVKGMAGKDITIALVCGADPYLTGVIAGMAVDFEIIRRVVVEDDIDAAQEMLESGKADVLLVIPDDAEYALFYGEPVVVRAAANDPLLGTLTYLLAGATLDTINGVKHITTQVYDEFLQAGISVSDSNRKLYDFINGIILDVILRYSYIEDIAAKKPYDTQAVTLVQFLVVAVSSLLTAVITAGQVCDGYLRRLAVRGIRAWRLIAVKMASSLVLSVLLCACALICFYAIGVNCDPARYFFSVALLSVIVTGMCLCVMTINTRRPAALARTMGSGAAVLLLLLFWGGGFYPTYLMDFSLRDLNPVWLSHLLAEWSFSGAFPPAGSFLLFLLPAVICTGVAAVRLRRSVCC